MQSSRVRSSRSSNFRFLQTNHDTTRHDDDTTTTRRKTKKDTTTIKIDSPICTVVPFGDSIGLQNDNVPSDFPLGRSHSLSCRDRIEVDLVHEKPCAHFFDTLYCLRYAPKTNARLQARRSKIPRVSVEPRLVLFCFVLFCFVGKLWVFPSGLFDRTPRLSIFEVGHTREGIQ